MTKWLLLAAANASEVTGSLSLKGAQDGKFTVMTTPEQVAAHDICGTLAQDEPDQAAEIMFGAFTCLDLEARLAEALFDAWEAPA